MRGSSVHAKLWAEPSESLTLRARIEREDAPAAGLKALSIAQRIGALVRGRQGQWAEGDFGSFLGVGGCGQLGPRLRTVPTWRKGGQVNPDAVPFAAPRVLEFGAYPGTGPSGEDAAGVIRTPHAC